MIRVHPRSSAVDISFGWRQCNMQPSQMQPIGAKFDAKHYIATPDRAREISREGAEPQRGIPSAPLRLCASAPLRLCASAPLREIMFLASRELAAMLFKRKSVARFANDMMSRKAMTAMSLRL
jgi:hypothetical protein